MPGHGQHHGQMAQAQHGRRQDHPVVADGVRCRVAAQFVQAGAEENGKAPSPQQEGRGRIDAPGAEHQQIPHLAPQIAQAMGHGQGRGDRIGRAQRVLVDPLPAKGRLGQHLARQFVMDAAQLLAVPAAALHGAQTTAEVRGLDPEKTPRKAVLQPPDQPGSEGRAVARDRAVVGPDPVAQPRPVHQGPDHRHCVGQPVLAAGIAEHQIAPAGGLHPLAQGHAIAGLAGLDPAHARGQPLRQVDRPVAVAGQGHVTGQVELRSQGDGQGLRLVQGRRDGRMTAAGIDDDGDVRLPVLPLAVRLPGHRHPRSLMAPDLSQAA